MSRDSMLSHWFMRLTKLNIDIAL